jgi:hypothetical protein
MKAIRLLAIAAVITGCHRAEDETPTKPPRPPPTPFTETAGLLAPIQAGSLTLTPIVTTVAAPKQDVDVMVLDEAFDQKLVTIKETPEQSVNALTLTNTAKRPLFLLAGEVILGGKQDRIIGQNTVIAANTTQSVPVFCVEHGRWTEGENGTVFHTAKALAHGTLRGKASFANQQEVWREVAAKNADRQIANSTGTYRQVANEQAAGSLGEQHQIDAAVARLDAEDKMKMIGYVVALNGKVQTVDMFESPTLFHKLEGKLVHSYVTDAVDVVAEKNVKPPTATEVKAFMSEADKAPAETSYDSGVAETVRYESKSGYKGTVDLKPSPYSEKMGKKEKAKAIYKTYQAKSAR